MGYLIGSILGALLVVLIMILIKGDLSFLRVFHGGETLVYREIEMEQKSLQQHALNLEAAANAKKELSITTMSHKEIIAQTSKWLPEGSRINFNNGVLTAFNKEGNEIDHNTFGEFDEYRQNRSMVDGIITKINVNYNIKEACESSVSYPQWDGNTETVEVYCKDFDDETINLRVKTLNRVIKSCNSILKSEFSSTEELAVAYNLFEKATEELISLNTKPSTVSLAKTPEEIDQESWNEILKELRKP